MTQLERAVERCAASRVFTVVDRRVHELHGLPIEKPYFAQEPGECHKTLDGWRALIDAFVEQRLDRDALVIAIGGGATLDLAGFAAATYLRGVRWIAVPTTLLAMVDAAWGGKTGVDLPMAKNLVGAFHPPQEVVVVPDFLRTLPQRETRAGLAEVVKHGVIGDVTLLQRAGRDDPASFVEDAARVKREIVERDPLEQGERRVLNLGHTLGHALEQASGYALHHGEAVAIGLRAACRIAELHCGFAQREVVEDALDRCGLPARTNLDEEAVLEAMAHDKKRTAKSLRWVLPLDLGDVRVFEEVPEEPVRIALREVLSPTA